VPDQSHDKLEYKNRTGLLKDLFSYINDLRRPKLLVRAARHGVESYNRRPHLGRYLASEPLPNPGSALMQLFEIEREMNDARLAKSGTYAPARHIDVLVAIMAEAQTLQASHQPRLVCG
jgi:hypothetical protein